MRDWQKWWDQQSSPRHVKNDDDFFHKHAMEIKSVTGRWDGLEILEFGCGNGALLSDIGICKVKRYVGVDFSSELITQMRTRFPDLEIHHSAVSEYRDQRKYNMIYSNALLQYLNKQETIQLLNQSKGMLKQNGIIIMCSVYWYRRFFESLADGLKHKYKINLVRGIYRFLKLKGKSNSEYWHTIHTFRSWAEENNFILELYFSIHYLPRIHIILRPKD
jgi:cyclopropane fatty-acyl-phospholipid synthase-like methyltransferase